MKVFEIFEAAPGPKFSVNDTGDIIDAVTGKVIRPGELLDKVNPQVANQLRSALAKQWQVSLANRLFGWLFITTPFVTILLQGVYNMSAVNWLWDSKVITASGKYRPGEVAQQMRKKVAKEFLAQLFAIIIGLLSIKTLQWLVDKAGLEKVGAFLSHISGKKAGTLIAKLSSVAVAGILLAILSTDTAKNFIVDLCMQAFPDVYSDAADVIGALGSTPLVAPATLKPVVDQAIEKAVEKTTGVQKTYNTGKSDEQPATAADLEKLKDLD